MGEVTGPDVVGRPGAEARPGPEEAPTVPGAATPGGAGARPDGTAPGAVTPLLPVLAEPADNPSPDAGAPPCALSDAVRTVVPQPEVATSVTNVEAASEKRPARSSNPITRPTLGGRRAGGDVQGDDSDPSPSLSATNDPRCRRRIGGRSSHSTLLTCAWRRP